MLGCHLHLRCECLVCRWDLAGPSIEYSSRSGQGDGGVLRDSRVDSGADSTWRVLSEYLLPVTLLVASKGVQILLGPAPPPHVTTILWLQDQIPSLCSAADQLVSRHGSKLPRNGNSEMDVKKQGASSPGEVSDLLGWAHFWSRPLDAAQCAESGSERLRLASPSPSKIPGCCMSGGIWRSQCCSLMSRWSYH